MLSLALIQINLDEFLQLLPILQQKIKYPYSNKIKLLDFYTNRWKI